MEGKVQGRLILILAALLSCLPAAAQEKNGQQDSLVRLMNAASLQLIEKDGLTYRKAIDATFLHNGTYLICDTALWSVDRKIIESEGNVRLMQEETVLTSDRLDYLIDEDLAKFRGSVVQLQDKDGNTLRTRVLDYNTKDSLAVFRDGGAMKDKDGQVMEGREGTYDSKTKIFTFKDDVNMYTDSIFVKTTYLEYNTDLNFATFPQYIDFWKDGNMLSAGNGWYNRESETFFFKDDVHALGETQETWSDSLYFYRIPNDIELRGEAQLQDTTRNVFSLSNYLYYQDSTSTVTIRDEAALAMQTKDGEKIDTVYVGADTFVYQTIKRCEIPEELVKDAERRLNDLTVDAVSEYRAKAAKAAAEEASKAAANDPNRVGKAIADKNRAKAGSKDKLPGGNPDKPSAPESPSAPSDTVTAAQDSLSAGAPLDSLATAPADSVQLDTTKLGFLKATGSVKVFRKDIQIRCDSLLYSDLDSIARFYIDPVIWNEGNRQYSSDSLYTLIRNNRVDKASLMSDAFVITQENEECYDQIKGAEILAYFDEDSALKRFDALGGATAVFFLEENDTFATVNKVESKMLSGTFVNGDIDRVFYFDAPKNDAYPVVQFPKEERQMKGFNWAPEKRPAGKDDITPLSIRPSQRDEYEGHPKASFKETDRYFPGYMASVYAGLAAKDEAKTLDKEAAKAEVPEVETPLDSLSAPADSLVAPVDSIAPALDSTIVTKADTTVVEKVLSAKELKARQKADKQAAKEKKWAELDAKEAAKAAAKKEKELQKKREKTRKAVLAQRRQEEKDRKKYERYVARYEKRYAGKLPPSKIDLDEPPVVEETQVEIEQ